MLSLLVISMSTLAFKIQIVKANDASSSGTRMLQVIQQYNVTFGQVGVGSDFTGTVLTVDGTNYTANDLPASFSWDNDSNHTFAFQSPLIAEANAEQYVWTGTSGLSPLQSDSINVTTDGSIVGNYTTQYNVTFDSTGVGSDFIGTSIAIDGLNYTLPTSFWYDSGSTHSFAFYSPLVSLVTMRPKYFWNSTTGLSARQSDSIVISGPGSVTGNYVSNVHQVIVTNITANPCVYQGYSTTIWVTIRDTGDYNESVWGAIYCNITNYYHILGSFTETLYMGQSFTFGFTWNTTGVPINYSGYTITVVATTATGTDTTSVTIQVRIVGDVNGDGKVDMRDIAVVARCFGSTPSSSNWNPNADINNDGTVNMRDIALVARNFGQHYP